MGCCIGLYVCQNELIEHSALVFLYFTLIHVRVVSTYQTSSTCGLGLGFGLNWSGYLFFLAYVAY